LTATVPQIFKLVKQVQHT